MSREFKLAYITNNLLLNFVEVLGLGRVCELVLVLLDSFLKALDLTRPLLLGLL